MDVRDLRMFAAVAEAGVVTHAATQLNTVQSNVTARIRALETELGAALFVRHSRGMSLTPAGTQLLPYANQILDLVEQARHAVSATGEARGALRIGSLETTTAIRLPPLLAGFGTRFPAVDLNLETGTTDQLVAAVLERKLDGAFVAGELVHPQLATSAIFDEELVIATSLQIDDIDRYVAIADEVRVLVFRHGCSYRKRLEALLARRGVARIKVLELGTLEGILGCVAAGLGMTLLPVSVVGTARMIAQHRLPAEESSVRTLFIKRRDTQAYLPLYEFERFVEEQVRAGEARSSLKSVA
jgi:LysR family transcriptional regulator, cell division regulator